MFTDEQNLSFPTIRRREEKINKVIQTKEHKQKLEEARLAKAREVISSPRFELGITSKPWPKLCAIPINF